MELLKELAPAANRIAVLLDGGFPSAKNLYATADQAARALGLVLQPVDVRSVEDINNAAPAIARLRSQGLMAMRAPVIHDNAGALAGLA
jgi:ABC-type uncharacterized transport system substrate-binding protein